MRARMTAVLLRIQLLVLSWVALLAGRMQVRLERARAGQSMLEYALVVAFVAVAVMAVVKLFGEAITGVFTRLINRLQGVG